jgi:YHS domain-containing protein
MHRLFSVLGILALGLVFTLSAHAADEKTKKDPLAECKCPVDGEKVVKDQVSEFDDGKVYFCCKKCKAEFDKDNAKYVAKAHFQMVKSAQFVQTACPYSGKEIAKDKDVEIDGLKVGFCCEKCQGKTAKVKEDAQIEMVFGEKTFDKGFKKAEVKKEETKK